MGAYWTALSGVISVEASGLEKHALAFLVLYEAFGIGKDKDIVIYFEL